MPFAVARDFMVLPVLLVYFILPITSRRPRQTSPVVRSVQFCPPSAFSRHDMAALALHAKITTIAKIILRNNIMISVICYFAVSKIIYYPWRDCGFCIIFGNFLCLLRHPLTKRLRGRRPYQTISGSSLQSATDKMLGFVDSDSK